MIGYMLQEIYILYIELVKYGRLSSLNGFVPFGAWFY